MWSHYHACGPIVPGPNHFWPQASKLIPVTLAQESTLCVRQTVGPRHFSCIWLTYGSRVHVHLLGPRRVQVGVGHWMLEQACDTLLSRVEIVLCAAVHWACKFDDDLTHSSVIRRTVNSSTPELELTGAGGDEDLSWSLLGSLLSSIIPNKLGSL